MKQKSKSSVDFAKTAGGTFNNDIGADDKIPRKNINDFSFLNRYDLTNALSDEQCRTINQCGSYSRQLYPDEFNHISREVIDLNKSLKFYVKILGFRVIPRPNFESKGCWLIGHGLNLHLVMSTNPEKRKMVKLRRIDHFTTNLPVVDHVAFVSSNMLALKKLLQDMSVYYKEECNEESGIDQIFFFDPGKPICVT